MHALHVQAKKEGGDLINPGIWEKYRAGQEQNIQHFINFYIINYLNLQNKAAYTCIEGTDVWWLIF